MSECTNKDIGKLLHAYELGQLEEQESDLFEEHLMDCSFCFEEAHKSQFTARMILADKENKKSLEEIVDWFDEKNKISDIKSIRKWPGYIKLSIAAAALIVLLLLNPWKIEFSPFQVATARENILAIMYFDDLTLASGKNRTGEIISDLLITDLAESGYITLVSEQRLYDLLRQLGHEGQKQIGKSLATQLAQKANAKYMLTGSLVQSEPFIVMTSQLIDVETGNVIASQKVTGNRGELIFPIIDELSYDIMHDLAFPDEALAKDQNICNITSCSLDAYQFYIEGMDYFYKFDYENADSLFRMAIGADSTFAMAYFRLSMSATDKKSINWAIKNAVANMANAGIIQQKYITAYNLILQEKYNQAFEKYSEIIRIAPDEKEAYYQLALILEARREWHQAISMLNKVIEIDPFYKKAYRGLAYLYEQFQEYDQSVWAISKYIEISPNEWVPFNTRGNLYTYMGKFDLAKKSYRKALEIKSDFTAAINNIAFVAIFERDYKVCDSMLEFFKANPNYKNSNMALDYQTYVLYSKGRIKKSLELLNNRNSAWSHLFGCSLYDRILGNYQKTLTEARLADSIMVANYPNLNDIMNMKGALAIALELNNRPQSSDSVLNAIYHFYDNAELKQYERYTYFRGIVERIRGNHDSAIFYNKKAVEIFPRFAEYNELALSYYAAGLYKQAIPVFEKALNRYDMTHLRHLPLGIVSHYYLGIAFKHEGYNDLALEQFKLFKEIWKDADSVVKQRFDVDKELRELKPM